MKILRENRELELRSVLGVSQLQFVGGGGVSARQVGAGRIDASTGRLDKGSPGTSLEILTFHNYPSRGNPASRPGRKVGRPPPTVNQSPERG